MKQFSPIMLTTARESRKLSQTALAKAAEITQSAVSQMESGIIAPSDDVAQRLGKALRYRESLFYSAAPFHELPVTFFRKQAQVGSQDVSAIRARLNLYRLRIATLLRSYEIEGARLLLTDLASEGITAAEAAQRLRVYWKVPRGPVDNLTQMVEAAGIVVVAMDFGTGAVDGVSIYEPNDVVPPMIFLNQLLPGDRWRLTLAHELGHISLHHHLRIPPSTQDMEEQAFEFAVEFLAPSREIAGHLLKVDMSRLAALKKHWKISMASLLRRAVSMGRVSERQERSLWMQLGKGRAEPVSIDAEKPQLLRAMVEYHQNELGYSVRQMSDVLHLQPEELRADFGINSAPLRLA